MIEDFAKVAHESWSGWMKYLFSKSNTESDGTVVIPKKLVERWKRQMNTDYKDLSEKEKKSDREEAKRYIAVIIADMTSSDKKRE